MLEPVTHRIVIKPESVIEQDEAYKIAKRMQLDLSHEKKITREQAAVDKGVVVSFGPTVFQDFHTDNPLTLGDEVIYARHAGKPVKDGDVEYVVINDEDVVAIVRKADRKDA